MDHLNRLTDKFPTLSKHKAEELLSNVLKYITKVAVENNGVLYGGYVRDHIVPNYFSNVKQFLMELQLSSFGQILFNIIESSKLLKLDMTTALSVKLDKYQSDYAVSKLMTQYNLTSDHLAKLSLSDVFYNYKTFQFKDIDIWFKTKEDANQFGQSLKQNLEKSYLQKCFEPRESGQLNNDKLDTSNLHYSTQDFYPFERTQYMFKLTSNDKDLIKNNLLSLESEFEFNLFFIDAIVSDKFPVNDFDVNLLQWDGNTLSCGQPCTVDINKTVDYSTTVEQLTSQIINKNVNVFNEYKVMAQSTGWIRNNNSCRVSSLRIQNYVANGWKVSYLN